MKTVLMLGRISTEFKAGIPAHVKSLITIFKNDYDIKFLNIVPSIKNFSKPFIISKLTRFSYEIECKSILKRKTLAFSVVYLRVILSYLRKYPNAPIHLHLPDPISILIVIAFTKKRKIIATYHADLVNKGIFSFIYKFLINLLIFKKCLFVFPTSKHLSSTFLAKKKIQSQVLPFIFSKVNFSSLENKYINEKLVNEETKLLFVGRHVTYKGIETLLKAFKTIKNEFKVSLTIVGKGPLTSSLKKMANNDCRIKFVGEISDKELSLLYCESHIFLLPSINRAEAFGIVQVEAMMRYCMCISSFLDNGVNVVNKEFISGRNFNPYDYEELKDLIIFYATNLHKRNALMTSAFHYSVKTFASNSLLKDYKSIYI